MNLNSIIRLTLLIMPLFIGCKCRIAKNPSPVVYPDLESSKKNKAFIFELKPESPFINIAGENYYIKEAWVEYPHLEKNFQDILLKRGRCVVINFFSNIHHPKNLHFYIKEDGSGSGRVWFNLPDEDYGKDTLAMHYRETLESAGKNNIFLFFKKE